MKRSNRGVSVDMDALAKQYENTIAVTGSGISMNAKGDILGKGGKVIKRVEQITKENSAMIKPESQKVSLSDMKKFTSNDIDLRAAMKGNNDKQKQEARKLAKKVELSTAAMANNGQPIIKDYSNEVEDEPAPKKPRRKIIED